MRMFFRRILPAMTSLTALLVALWQGANLLTYPYPLTLFFVGYLVVMVTIAWRQLAWSSWIEKMVPSTLSLLAIGFAYLVTDAPEQRLVLSFLLAAVSFLALELLFLLVYDAEHYPVHGLSRLNIALVPLTVFFVSATWNGLSVFIHVPRAMIVIVMMGLGALLYLLTSHPTAEGVRHWGWGILGAIVGLHVAGLILFLPVQLVIHGALGALLFAIPLRFRRYSYQPVPPVQLAYAEAIFAGVCFFGVLFSTKWV